MQLANWFTTTIAQKIMVALTGILMILFIIAHLLGNLEIFSGQDALNQYAALLKTFPKAVWAARLGLLAAITTHVWLTIKLTLKNREAKNIKYAHQHYRKTTLSSRIMMLSGLTILCFIVYHLAHFTLLVTNPEYSDLVDFEGRHDVYSMVIAGFSNPVISLFYVVAQVLLAFHISHGISSCFRTLGVSDEKVFALIKKAGNLFAVVIAALYISIPASVLLGYLTL